MPFASELDIRDEAFLDDYQTVESERLNLSLEKAHREILAETTLIEESEATPEIKRAEALLAISHFFQSLAIAEAVTAEELRTPEFRLNEHGRVTQLISLSNRLWQEAWSLLHPYLNTAAPPMVLVTRGENS